MITHIENLDNYIPYKILVKLNTIDCREYIYNTNILQDVIDNYKKYYSIKIQYKYKNGSIIFKKQELKNE